MAPDSPLEAFVSCVAQHDNLGDLVIRRTVVRWLAESCHTPHVLVEGMPKGFVDGLQLEVPTVLYRSRVRWLAALARSAARGPIALVFTPGPQSLTVTTSQVWHALVNLMLAQLVTLRSGTVLKIGRSIEPGSLFMLALERSLARRISMYTVRDEQSKRTLQIPHVAVAPDVAWNAGLESELVDGTVPRFRLAMSFRSDRSFDRRAVVNLVEEARRRDLVPTLVTQVRRDDALHRRLAEELGCDLIHWPVDRYHRLQLRAVLRAYQESVLVVSNRLHSVIFGMIAGGTPLALTSSSDTKIRRTLAVVGIGHRVAEVTAPIPSQLFEPLDLTELLACARARLEVERTESQLRRPRQ